MGKTKLFVVPDDGDTEFPFRDFAEKYYAAGWIPLTLDPQEKEPPPNRTTGRYPVPTWDVIKSWIRNAKHHNIGVRMPDGMIGIDVDAYKEGGPEQLAKLSAELGALPDTWISSARADGLSGIRYFRIPPGLHLPANLGTGIDIVQFRHRYAVAPPSIHPNGERYKWYSPGSPLDGSGTSEPPVIQRVLSGR
jgi:hypothetical protein